MLGIPAAACPSLPFHHRPLLHRHGHRSMDRRSRLTVRRRPLPAATLFLICLVVVVAAAAAREERLTVGGCPAAAGGEKKKQQLWVFGDSYADTGNLGNLGRELTHAWYDPYGRTFPGRPTGRFSDGRILTDFVASAMGMPTPVAYKLRRRATRGLLARGMNFAVGGSGLLDTGYLQRNISAQIDLFLAQRKRGCNGTDMGAALLVVSGNDYSYVADKDNSTAAAIAYIPTVVREMREQLRRLRDEAGMGKVVVTNLHPMGCTPLFTRPLNYTACDPLANVGAAQHNAALRSVIAALDPGNRTFLILDLNTPIAAFVDDDDGHHGNGDKSSSRRFPNTLRPCCETFSPDGYCGQQDDHGNRQYTLCDDPDSYFYWDDVHPTQAGWAAVAESFRATVQDFLSTT